jgi:hypothetical protein
MTCIWRMTDCIHALPLDFLERMEGWRTSGGGLRRAMPRHGVVVEDGKCHLLDPGVGTCHGVG